MDKNKNINNKQLGEPGLHFKPKSLFKNERLTKTSGSVHNID